MCAARLFSQGVDLFALNFFWTGSPPSNICGIRNLEALGYPMVQTSSIRNRLHLRNS